MASRAPIAVKPEVARGTVRIREAWCKGCELCIEHCPTRVLALSSDFNAAGYHHPEVVDDTCICCQACSTICPEFAIYCIPKAA